MFQILCSRKRETILPTVCLCSRFYVAERGKLYPINSMFMLQILCSRKRESVSYLQYVYVLDFMQQKEGNCILLTVCLCSRFYVAERGNLYPTYSMFMFQILCSRKRETVSYLQYVYVLDFMQQKEGICILPTVCLCSRFYVAERGKLYPTYSMFMFQILCSRKGKLYPINSMFMFQILCSRNRESVSYLQYVYVLDFMQQIEGNCILPTVCLCSRFYVAEIGNLYPTYSMFMFQILCSRKRETVSYSMFMFSILCSRKRESVSYLQYVYVLDFMQQKEGNVSHLQYVYVLDCMQQKEGNCILPTVCLCSRFYVVERGNLYPTYSMFMFQILCSRKRETVSY